MRTLFHERQLLLWHCSCTPSSKKPYSHGQMGGVLTLYIFTERLQVRHVFLEEQVEHLMLHSKVKGIVTDTDIDAVIKKPWHTGT